MIAMHFLIALCVVVLLCVFQDAEANYKKPPFNGSIFGKRGNIDYDTTGRALSSLCEIATDTCQAWYQAIENK